MATTFTDIVRGYQESSLAAEEAGRKRRLSNLSQQYAQSQDPTTLYQIAALDPQRGAALQGIQQQFQHQKSISDYLQDPTQQTLSRIAASNPQAANSIMAVNKMQQTTQARKMRALHNTWQKVPISQRPNLYKKWREENQEDMDDYPIEYNEQNASNIDSLFDQDNEEARLILGEKPERAVSTVGQIQEDLTRGRLTPELAQRAIEKAVSTKPTTVISLAGKAPKGYRFEDPRDPQSSLVAIKGGPAEKLPATAAGKSALVEQGSRDMDRFKEMLFDKKGKLDRTTVTLLNAPYIPPGKARRAYSAIFNAINARLRLESGAAVPESEVKRAMKAFLPKPLDDVETANFKIDRMKEFFDIFQETLGTGRSPAQQPIKPTFSGSVNGIKWSVK